MPRLSKSDEQRRELDFWKGGKLAESAVRSHLAEVERKRAAEIAEKVGVQQKAARLLSQLQTPVEPAEGASAAKALSGLRDLTKKIPKLKPALKKPSFIPPYPVWGRYTLNFTPPNYLDTGTYTNGQTSSVTGNPTISATGDVTTGSMTCTVETNEGSSPSGGTASNFFGVYFKPQFPVATVQISFDSEISWYWYVNSIRNKEAIAQAQGLIELYQYDGAFLEPPVTRGAFIGFSEAGVNTIDFDFFSGPGPTWSLQAPVNGDFFYFIVVRLSCTASGSGWPGSLAGASATVTIPSITVTVSSDWVPPFA